MADLAKILYEQFFRRDLLGKVGPGLLVAFLFQDQFSELGVSIDLSASGLLVVVPFAYALGVALQIGGEYVGLHSASPYPHRVFRRTTGRWHDANIHFRDRLTIVRAAAKEGNWSADQESQRERFVVLKELSGNYSTALFVLLAVNLVGSDRNVPLAVFAGVLASLLWLSHRLHALRQAQFEINSLEKIGEISKDIANSMRNTLNPTKPTKEDEQVVQP